MHSNELIRSQPQLEPYDSFKQHVNDFIRLDHTEHKYSNQIFESLINLLKNDTIISKQSDAIQIIDLISLFRMVSSSRQSVLSNLTAVALEKSEIVNNNIVAKQNASAERITLNRIACLKEFSACINSSGIAKVLSSTNVRVSIKFSNIICSYITRS